MYFLLVVLLLLLQFVGIDIDFYGVLAAVGILLMTIDRGICGDQPAQKVSRRIQQAFIKIPRPWLIVLAIADSRDKHSLHHRRPSSTTTIRS